MLDKYPFRWKNSRYDLIILLEHFWGGIFHMSVIEERQVTGGIDWESSDLKASLCIG
jgi:hypothetical protein